MTITIPGNLTSPPYLRGLRTLLDATRWAFLADEIEAQTQPPRIPEPGLWGVVEAYPQSRVGGPVHFLRDSGAEDAAWRSVANGSAWEWDDLIDPTLIRPGIEDAS